MPTSTLGLLVNKGPIEGTFTLGKEGEVIVENVRRARKLKERWMAIAIMIGRYRHYEKFRKLERLIAAFEKSGGEIIFRKKDGTEVPIEPIFRKVMTG